MPNKKPIDRIKEITPEEMSSLIDKLNSFGIRYVRIGEGTKYPTRKAALKSAEWSSFATCATIEETLATLEVTTKYWGDKFQVTTWSCSLNGIPTITVNGRVAYMQFQRAAKIPTLKQLGIEEDFALSKITGRYQYSAIPMIGSKTQNKAVFRNVYMYDRNSAYASTIALKMPSFKVLDRDRVVKVGEIGWLLTENLALRYPGQYADYITPLIDTPIEVKNYIKKWYDLKNTGDQNAKAMLNFPIGYYQRTNPLFRAYVVNSCNDTIYRLISEEDTILWNTDAIYTLKPRKLTIGEEIGQWKVEKIDKITIFGCNYQVNNDTPVYRGIPKQWFESFERIHGRPFDLERDDIPKRINRWYFDRSRMKLEQIK